jgi:coproporphyrinogen III oxidase
MQAVGNGFPTPTFPASGQRKVRWCEREREFRSSRRGRYVEFSLVCDRGTPFGLRPATAPVDPDVNATAVRVRCVARRF